MKKFEFIIVLILLLRSVSGFTQSGQGDCNSLSLMVQALNKYHYAPPPLNRTTSGEIYNTYLEMLDPYKLVFTEEDLNILQPFKNELLTFDSEEKPCEFLKTAITIFKFRLEKTGKLVDEILQKPFDFSVNDTIVFYADYGGKYAATEKELVGKWTEFLKYKALLMMTTGGNDSIIDRDTQKMLAKEPDIRKKLQTRQSRFFDKMLKSPMGFENYMSLVFRNTIANRFDPHTNYFSFAEKEEFQKSLSKESMSFGIEFSENKNGDVQIEYLTPGGAAWKSNELNKGDVLISVKWPGSDPTDMTYSTAEEAGHILSASPSEKVQMTVRKANGMLKTVNLIKEKTEVTENIVMSYVLSGEKKVGYIPLPGFYTEWGSNKALGCANDVAKEILKLQKENIDGVILDLRNNGGGSLYEAVNLAGLFINEGPLLIQRQKSMKPSLIKDLNRGTVYNGPLIVLVNGLSASASEFVTVALKDYNRALIVGSPTYGKAIGQTLLPVDTVINFETYTGNADNAKSVIDVTTFKLYRVNGSSYQKTGIVPDIVLPDLSNNKLYGEASEPYALTPDSISKKVIYTPLAEIKKEEIYANSNNRVNESDAFSRIKQIADSLITESKNDKRIPLNINSFISYLKKVESLSDQLDKISRVSDAGYSVSSTIFDKELLNADLNRKKIFDDEIENLKDDIYIKEAYAIMKDLIKTLKQ